MTNHDEQLQQAAETQSAQHDTPPLESRVAWLESEIQQWEREFTALRNMVLRLTEDTNRLQKRDTRSNTCPKCSRLKTTPPGQPCQICNTR